jgi:peptide/nickel transport system substrate-binding protein
LLSAAELHFPYPYDPTKAKGLLSGHGWAVRAGVATCERAGVGSGECGLGIAHGARLQFTGLYATGSVPLSVEFQAMRSAWSTAGIQVTLKQIPTAEVLTQAEPCNRKTGVGCSWALADPNDFWTYDPDYYPTGGEIFGAGAGSNEGGYSNARNDSYIRATHLNASSKVFAQYENNLTQQLPVLWLPTPYYQISVISKRLHGTMPQSPIAFIYPEEWVVS